MSNVDLTRYEGVDEHYIAEKGNSIESVFPFDERFALLDFREVSYTDGTKRFQAVLIDRQRGWAKINGVHLKFSDGARFMAWALLRTWAEEAALDRMHPVEQTHRGGLKGCTTCSRFFLWLKGGGFGDAPPGGSV